MTSRDNTPVAVEHLAPCPICGADVTDEQGFADNFGSGPYRYASCSECTYQADLPDHRRLAGQDRGESGWIMAEKYKVAGSGYTEAPVSDIREALEQAQYALTVAHDDAANAGYTRLAQYLSAESDKATRALAHAAVGEGYAVVPVKWNLEMYSVYHSRQDYAKAGEPLSISEWWPHFLEAAAPRPIQAGEGK